MNKAVLTLLSCILLASTQVMAQGTDEFGMRVGSSMWLKDYPQNQQFTMDKTLYFRKETPDRFAFEASLDQYSFNYTHQFSAFDETYGTPYTIEDHATHQYLALALSVQYKINGDQKEKLKGYLGANMTPVYIYGYTTDHDYIYPNSYYQQPEVVTLQKKISTVKMIGGFNYTLKYAISKHIAASMLVQYQVMISKIFNADVYGIKWEHLPSSCFSLQAGLGYYFTKRSS